MKFIFLLLICYTVNGQNNGDLESLIKQIFGEPGSPGQTTGSPPTPITGTPNLISGHVGNDGGVNLNPSEQTDLSCKTEDGEDGECVHYYLCSSNNSIITDGVGIIDIRVRDGECTSYLDTCCLLPDRRAPDNPITPPPPPKEESHEGCGWRNPDGIGFRIKGDMDNEAKFGEFPWMVAILKIEPVNDEEPDGQKLNVYVGGGSLIHPNVVLTAAHYVTGRKTLKIRAGEWDTQTKKEIYPYQDREVKEVIVHKDFNSGSLFYDIAILILSEPLELAPNVGLACLPEARQRAPSGARCFASGWGKDQFGKDGRYQVILKRVEVPVVDRQTCEAQLQKTRLGRNFRLHSSFMCAGGEPGRDTCKGDGGSPLVCPIESERGRYQQNGIVAWGIGCGEDGTPGVYVDVANLRDWIDDVVAGKGYNTRSYSIY